MKQVARAVETLPKLYRVSLAENEIGSAGAKRLAKALRQRSRAFGAVDTLTELDVSTCDIHSSGILALVEAAASCPNLRKLVICNNFVSESTRAKIEALQSERTYVETLSEVDEDESDYEEEEDVSEAEEVDETVNELAAQIEQTHV